VPRRFGEQPLARVGAGRTNIAGGCDGRHRLPGVRRARNGSRDGAVARELPSEALPLAAQWHHDADVVGQVGVMIKSMAVDVT
jgi:hypothetical protein